MHDLSSIQPGDVYVTDADTGTDSDEGACPGADMDTHVDGYGFGYG